MFIAKISYETLWAGSKVSACLQQAGQRRIIEILFFSIAPGICLTPFEPAPLLIIQKSINIKLLTESNLY